MVSMPEVYLPTLSSELMETQGNLPEGALSFWNAVLVSNSTELIGNEKHSITDYTGLKRSFQRIPAAACQGLNVNC